MSISQALLPEYDQEMASTRKFLERFPEGKDDWTPHEKSMPLGKLACHVAELPSWASHAVTSDSLDVAPPGGEPYQTPIYDSRDELLAAFDRNVAAARAAIAGASDDTLARPWSLQHGGHDIFTLPKAAVIRSFVMNHLIHHRAQLGVYYRLNGIPVPSVYGPSADDQGS